MSTQYRLVQSGKTASGGCSAGQGSSELWRHGLLLLLLLLKVTKAVRNIDITHKKFSIACTNH
jgi:hypothetical protein